MVQFIFSSQKWRWCQIKLSEDPLLDLYNNVRSLLDAINERKPQEIGTPLFYCNYNDRFMWVRGMDMFYFGCCTTWCFLESSCILDKGKIKLFFLVELEKVPEHVVMLDNHLLTCLSGWEAYWRESSRTAQTSE